MGYDPVIGPNTYGSGCMPGCARQFEWWRANYQAGSLGCYNPASLGGRSLHAEGRAMDIALDARDPAQRARGDAIVARVVANPDQFGAQEMLWRGGVWSYRRRAEGWRTDPPVQQADHMNHVHLGIDVNAARHWTPAWVQDAPAPTIPEPKEGEVMLLYNVDPGGGYYEYDGLSVEAITDQAHGLRLSAGVDNKGMETVKLHGGDIIAIADRAEKRRAKYHAEIAKLVPAGGGAGWAGPDDDFWERVRAEAKAGAQAAEDS